MCCQPRPWVWNTRSGVGAFAAAAVYRAVRLGLALRAADGARPGRVRPGKVAPGYARGAKWLSVMPAAQLTYLARLQSSKGQVNAYLAPSPHSAGPLHTTHSKREASQPLMCFAACTSLPVAYNHSKISTPPCAVAPDDDGACDTRACAADALKIFGFFSLHRISTRKQHGVPPTTGGRVCKPVLT